MLQPACTMLWKFWTFYPVLFLIVDIAADHLWFMLIFMWNFVIKAHIPNVPTFLDYGGW